MFENTKFKTGVDYYHRLSFIFNLILALPLIPFGLLYLRSLKDNSPFYELTETVSMVIDLLALFFAIILLVKAILTYRKERAGIIAKSGLRLKMIELHDSLLKGYSRLLIACFLATFGFFFTGSKIHVVLFVIILVLFSLKRPSLKLIVEELELKNDESQVLRERAEIE